MLNDFSCSFLSKAVIRLGAVQCTGRKLRCDLSMQDAASMLALAPGTASAAAWTKTNFFTIGSAEEHTLKIRLAQHLGLRYANCNQEKPFAEDYGGVSAFNPDRVIEGIKAKEDNVVLSMTISAMMISWKPSSLLNQDYILNTCTKYVDNWDMAVERKA